MNAPPSQYRPPRREDYEPIVKGIIPFCDGEELHLRAGLLLMRDRAMASKAGAVTSGMSTSAWALLDLVERESSEAAFHAMPIEVLREFRELCVKCVVIAQAFDRIYQPKLPGLEDGEAA